MSNRTFLVAQREYLENLRTKAFWIGIFFLPVLLTLSIIIPVLLEQTKDVRHYAVIDRSGWLLQEVEQRALARDLERLLTAALEDYLGPRQLYPKWPQPLREAVESLAGQLESGRSSADSTSDLVGSFAASAARAPTRNPSPRAPPGWREAQGGLLRWWESLGPDEAGQLPGRLSKGLYRRIPLPKDLSDPVVELNRMVAADELFAYFVIGMDPVRDSDGSKYVSGNLTDDDLRNWFGSLASVEIRERRLAGESIDRELARWIQEPLRFEVRQIGREGQVEEVSEMDVVRQWAPVAFVYLLWLSVFSISQGLLTSTIEEKSNRIIEVLLSSVTPLQLMGGKIAGIAATGLTVVGSWVLFFSIAVKLLPWLLGGGIDLDLTAIVADPVFLGSFLSYFLLGYLFFSAFLVAIGSACTSLKEAQNLMMPVTILLIVPLLAMVPISKDPNGTLARFLSYIPPFTPFVMMNRAAGPPSTLEYVMTTLLLLVSIALVLWGAAKIFRVGILMTGKAPNLFVILKWLRAPVGQIAEKPPSNS